MSFVRHNQCGLPSISRDPLILVIITLIKRPSTMWTSPDSHQNRLEERPLKPDLRRTGMEQQDAGY
jgi:hypothetical protein